MKLFLSPNSHLDEVAVVALTQPIDMFKTRMQSKHACFTYKNSLNCAYRIFIEEGFSKLWKGWAARLLKVSLSVF